MDVMPAPEAPCDASSPNCIPQGLGRLLQETPAFSLGCDPSGQRLALTLVYYLVNGPGWINSSGWPIAMQGTNPFAMAMHMATVPLETGVCTSASQSSADAPAIILPDHCCWYGIRCCTPQTCGNNPFCNCTTGLVTSIQPNGNKVRVRVRVRDVEGSASTKLAGSIWSASCVHFDPLHCLRLSGFIRPLAFEPLVALPAVERTH